MSDRTADFMALAARTGRDWRVYAIMYDALDYGLKPAQRKHLSAEEFCRAFVGFIVEDCGLLALSVLEWHAILWTGDIGMIVHEMIRADILTPGGEDSIDDFCDIDFFDLWAAVRKEMDQHLSRITLAEVSR